MRCHSAPRGGFVQRKDCVSSAASLERADLLKIFALKKQRRAACFIEALARQHWRAMNMCANPLMRRANRSKIELLSYFDHPKKASITPNVSIIPCVRMLAQRFRPATI